MSEAEEAQLNSEEGVEFIHVGVFRPATMGQD